MAHRCSALLAVALLLAGCTAETHRDQYPVGQPGQVAFRNETGMPLYLAGCSRFDYEEQVAGEWVTRDPENVCVWEGFAEPVTPGRFVTDALDTQRTPGTWRVRYQVGVACREDEPLAEAHCAELLTVASNAFEVSGEGCAIGGCSSQLCGEKATIHGIGTTCEWLPQYGCFRSARCGRFGPAGECTWELTPELLACLSDALQDGGE
jgi:hypothetical protein